MAAVDRSSPMPVYFQIALDVRRRIAAGEWVAGERIAPELQLVREYAVSRVTIRQALAELVKDDLLERKRGSGTYVRPQPRPLLYDLSLTLGEYASRIREMGFTNRAEVIDAGIVEAPNAELRSALALPRHGRVVYLLRRVLINEEPSAVYRSWFDAEVVPGIERSPGLTGSLSDVLAHDYDLVPVRSEASLEVARSTREEASMLETTSDMPLFVVTATTYLPDGRPLEYSQMMWPGDRVRFHVSSGEPVAHASR
jgi:DNA-binding GntR family transcriptional regulator